MDPKLDFDIAWHFECSLFMENISIVQCLLWMLKITYDMILIDVVENEVIIEMVGTVWLSEITQDCIESTGVV